MIRGCVIFAYDGDIAYGPQAVLAARLVKKHLQIPVSLITDQSTASRIDLEVFESVIYSPLPETQNSRMLAGQRVAFKNTNRSSVYFLTPYERTLVIDSDFLVFSDRLKTYLDSNYDFMICESMHDLCPGRPGSKVQFDPSSLDMLWATNIIFNKTAEVETLFGLVDHIRDNWQWYSSLYKFNWERFRNDYAFTVASHMMGDNFHTALPSPILFNDQDQLIKISQNGLSWITGHQNQLVKTHGQDIHMMNKFDLMDNLDRLMELTDD
jgi:hypothetical protein